MIHQRLVGLDLHAEISLPYSYLSRDCEDFNGISNDGFIDLEMSNSIMHNNAYCNVDQNDSHEEFLFPHLSAFDNNCGLNENASWNPCCDQATICSGTSTNQFPNYESMTFTEEKEFEKHLACNADLEEDEFKLNNSQDVEEEALGASVSYPLNAFQEDLPTLSEQDPLSCLDIQNDSLDMIGMIEDFMNETDQKTNFLEDDQDSYDCANSSCSTNSTNLSVTKLERTPSYNRKRSQNNKACRESRKKRKLQQVNAEKRVVELIEDNKNMRLKISELEVEVKRTRDSFMAQLYGKKRK